MFFGVNPHVGAWNISEFACVRASLNLTNQSQMATSDGADFY